LGGAGKKTEPLRMKHTEKLKKGEGNKSALFFETEARNLWTSGLLVKGGIKCLYGPSSEKSQIRNSLSRGLERGE